MADSQQIPGFAPLYLRPRPRCPLISVKYARTLLRSRRGGNFVTETEDVFVTMSRGMQVLVQDKNRHAYRLHMDA